MEDWKPALARFVRGLVGSVLQRIVAAAEEATSFHDLGLDSDKLIELTRILNESAGLKLRPSVLFSHYSITALVAYLLDEDRGGVLDRYAVADTEPQGPYSLIDMTRSDPATGRFAKTLTTAEFFMQGHIYDGQYNFPGACYIEMALQAAAIKRQRRFPVALANNYFLRRLSSFGEELNVELLLHPAAQPDSYKYIIGRATTRHKSALDCAQGDLLPVADTQNNNVVDWSGLCDERYLVRHHSDVVRQLITEGDQVDDRFIAARKVYVRNGEVLAELALSDQILQTHDGFILHPALLAGFMQAARVCNAPGPIGESGLHITPMAIERVEVFATPPSTCHAFAKIRAGDTGAIRKFDGVLTDGQGRVCVEIRGFAIRQSVAPAVKVTSAKQPNLAIVDHLRGLVAPLLGYEPEALEAARRFDEYISNSIVIVEINNRLEEIFGELSKTLLFEYETLEALAEYFVAEHADVLRERLQLRWETRTRPPLDRASVPRAARYPELRPDSEHAFDPFPLTDMQASFLVGRELGGRHERVGCHIYAEFTESRLDVDRLMIAWNALVQHHAMLRARILPDGVQQVMQAVPPYGFQVYSVDGGDEAAHLHAVRKRLSHHVYEAGAWPMFSIAVSRLSDDRAVVHFSIDELIIDGLSWHLLMRQWHRLYHEPDYTLSAPRLSFRDHVQAITGFAASDKHRSDSDYWAAKLSELPPAACLPVAARAGYVAAEVGRRRYESRLGATTWGVIKRRARDVAATPTSVLLTLFCEAIASVGSVDAFPLLLTYLNRPPAYPELHHVVGPFISSTVFVARRLTQKTLSERVLSNQAQLWEDIEHASVSGPAALRAQQRRHKQIVRVPIVFTSFLGVVDDVELSWVKHLSYMVTQTPQVYWDHQVFERDGDLYFSWDIAEQHVDPQIAAHVFAVYCNLLHRLAIDDDAWSRTADVVAAVEREAGAPDDGAAFPLTEMQGSYLYSRLADPEAGVCHLYQEFECGRIDVDRLEAAMRRLIAAHPMLRTAIRNDGVQQTRQYVPDHGIDVVTLNGNPSIDQEAALLERRNDLLATRFGLDSWPHFRLAVTHQDATRSRLHCLFDLIIADGDSVHLILQQLIAHYNDPACPEQPPATSFRGYVEAPASSSRGQGEARATDYWRQRFAALPQGPNLRRDGEVQEGGTGHVRLSENLVDWALMKERAEQFGVRPASVLLTAYCEVLAGWSTEAPFTVIVPSWHRASTHPGLEDVVGDFTALRWVVAGHEGSATFLDRVNRIQAQLDEDAAHWRSGALQQLRQAKRGQGASMPTFPVVFTDLMPHAKYEDRGAFRLGYGVTQTPQVALDNISVEVGCALQICWDVDCQRLSREFASGMLAEYVQLLSQLIVDESAWHEVSQRSAAARSETQIEGPDRGDAGGERLHHHFERQAALHPNATALIFGNRAVSYRELNEAANRYANHLRSLGVHSGKIVGVLAERSVQMVIGLLAIVKAGGAYLPIDPAYPQARISYLLEDADVDVLLLDADLIPAVEGYAGASVDLTTESEAVMASSSEAPVVDISPDDLCYVIYTSGSTGRPKGCMVPHKAILNRLLWMQGEYPIGDGDRVFQKTPFSFDVSVWEFFWPLMAGATLVIAEPGRHKDPRYLIDVIQARQITVCHFVPSMLSCFLSESGVAGCRSLRHVFASGEALSSSLVRKFRSLLPARLHNLYGPTEAAVDVTYWECVERPDGKVPIGRPIMNIEIHLLDDRLRPVPHGDLGEIHIGGVGLALGYLNRPELTAERFVPSPYVQGQKLYRTGDIGRLLVDGNIEYCGRRDSQVKLRGFRIELGEIETALMQQPDIDGAAVVVQDADTAEPKLVAYYVPSSGGVVTAKTLRGRLSQHLPEYCVPNRFVALDEIPSTAHGKLDRDRLPWPLSGGVTPLPGRGASLDGEPDVASLTTEDIARRLMEITKPILGVKSLQPEEDLFDCGATSLTMVRIRQAIEKELDVTFQADEFVEGVLTEPTIAWIAKFIAREMLPVQERSPGLSAQTPAAGGPGPSGPKRWAETADGFAAALQGVELQADAFAEKHYLGVACSGAVEPMSMGALSALLSRLSAQTITGLPGPRYLFPSAGEKKGVQTYLAVRADSGTGLHAGLYYYQPEKHALFLISEGLSDDLFPHGREDAAADIHIVLIAQLAALRPIYQGHSDYMAAVEAGYMTQALIGDRRRHGVQLDVVDDFDPPGLRVGLKLDNGHRILAALACRLTPLRKQGGSPGGNRPTVDAARTWARGKGSPITVQEHRAASDLSSLRPHSDLELKALDREQRHLRRDIEDGVAIALERESLPQDRYLVRACQRHYLDEPVALGRLGRLLSLLRPRVSTHATAYLYPSLHSLYGVEVYVYVRDGGVAGLASGLYRYAREAHELISVKTVSPASFESSHTPFNRRHFRQSAFSFFFVAKAGQLRPTFGDAFVHHALQEAGSMSQLLLEHQAEFRLGLCPIGGANFERIRADFGIDEDDCFLHQLVGGSVAWDQVDARINALDPDGDGTAGGPASSPASRGNVVRGDDLAIVGISGRYPGADDLETLWENLKTGRRSIGAIPVDRWQHVLNRPTSVTCDVLPSAGAFLEGVDRFDSLLFNISPLEARAMDPQERLFLEVAWECFENAGYRAATLAGPDGRVGVFVGAMWSDYQCLAIDRWQPEGAEPTTSFHSDIANRVSHVFDLHGPSLSVGTSCASSLTSIHLAAESLRRGDCSVALAGGVNLVSHPYHLSALNRYGLLSSDGRSNAFSAQAAGWVVGEGVGAVLIKPLDTAIADGDHIHGVIKATTIEHSGRTRQYRAASTAAQSAIARVLRKSGVDARDISYVETAAAGASLADASEMAALSRSLGLDPNQPACALGSIKPNIGHSESASGMSQLAKVILQLDHRQLSPSIDSDPLSPLIQLDGTRLQINRTLRDWDEFARGTGRRGPLTALINGFGASGSSGHLVIQEAPNAARDDASAHGSEVVILSAMTRVQLDTYATRLLKFVGSDKARRYGIRDVAATLQSGREEMDERLAIVADSLDDLRIKLSRYLSDGPDPDEGVFAGTAGPADAMAESTQSVLPYASARLWTTGARVAWLPDGVAPYRKVPLPTYPFARERHWIGDNSLGGARTDHPDRSETDGAADRMQLRRRIGGFLREVLSEGSGIPQDALRFDVPFDRYGLNSGMIQRMNARLAEIFGEVPRSMFFEFQTLDRLTDYFLDSQRGKLFQQFGVAEAPPQVRQSSGNRIEASGATTCATARSVATSPRSGGRGDVAVIGLAGRFPQAEDISVFWENLKCGRDCIGDLPEDRAASAELIRQIRGHTRAGYVDGVDRFDPLFFGIAPSWAELMDPQERLFLETAWHTMEDAGYSRRALQVELGARVGVFVGVMYNDYQLLGPIEDSNGHRACSPGYGSIANRVSYHLGLRGPSLAVDTMCSSSMTAIHLAVESLRRGECAAAFAGGVNVLVHPNRHILHAQFNMTSPSGLCRSFGAGADGFVPGEGVCAVLLKPLAAAEADGDMIYGVIKGSAINHDGKSSGYTAPNPLAQREVIRAALADAGIDPRTVGYVEAHGTGTVLGDPIEFEGLVAAFDAGTSTEEGCALGSVKSNIGHLESAAGVAALAKVLLQLRHKKFVPSLHSEMLNPDINLAVSPFHISRSYRDWMQPVLDVDGRPTPILRRAGISSFGAGGSNAHLVVEEYDQNAAAEPEPRHVRLGARVIVLSALTGEALKAYCQRLLNFFSEGEGRPDAGLPVSLDRIEHTLLCGRDAFDERIAFMVNDRRELMEQLSAFCDDGSLGPHTYRGRVENWEQVTSGVRLDDEVISSLAQVLLKRGDLESLAQLWVNGAAVDWTALFPDRRPPKASLPTYPFARERHWVEAAQGQQRGDRQASGDLAGRNESTFDGIRFATRFTGHERFLEDHRILGLKTLPGAVQVEMARAACGKAAEQAIMRLRDVVWLDPARAADGGFDVSVTAQRVGGSFNYQVMTVGPDGGRVTVHSRGTCDPIGLSDAMAVAPVDVVDLQARCASGRDPEALYRTAADAGLAYGPSFRSITALRVGEDEALADIAIADEHFVVFGAQAFNPLVVDAALQAVYALALGDQKGAAWLPFAIDRIDFLHPLPTSCQAHVSRRSTAGDARASKYDVTLFDRSGTRLANIEGVVFRPVDRASELGEHRVEGAKTSYYSPIWQPADLDESSKPTVLSAAGASVLLFSPNAAWAADLRDRLNPHQLVVVCPGATFDVAGAMDYVVAPRSEEDFSALFNALQAKGVRWRDIIYHATDSAAPGAQPDMPLYPLTLLVCQLIKHGLGDGVRLHYVYEGDDPRDAAIAGFAESVQKEEPRLVVRTINFRSRGTVGAQTRAVIDELNHSGEGAGHIMYADRRYVRHVERLTVDGAADRPSPIRHQGVYLITGGLGAIGRLVAQHLSGKYRAKLILVGRSQLDGSGRKILAELQDLGGEAEYIRADVSHYDDCERALNQAKARFGRLDGIIHTAGVNRDSLVLNKTSAAIDEVIGAKALGVLHLDAATRAEPLDFVVLFSSLVGVIGNVGQTDYGYANAFLDAFAEQRERLRVAGKRTGKTLSIAWPFWEGGGMSLDPETKARLNASYGLVPLETEAGLQAFETAIRADADRVIVVESVGGLAKGLFLGASGWTEPSHLETRPVRREPDAETVARGWLEDYLRDLVSIETKIPAARIDLRTTLDRYGVDSVMMVSITKGLEQLLGSVSKTLLFEFQSLDKLCDHLMGQYGPQLSSAFRETKGIPLEAPGVTSLSLAVTEPAAPVSEAEARPSIVGAGAEEIAIIGLSGRYPMANTPGEFWNNLKSGRDCVTEIPTSRWDFREDFSAGDKTAGKSYTKWGGFISDVDAFDAKFFRVTPTDARHIDPQQRLFLEAVYAAIEDAGYTGDTLGGAPEARDIGVFLGTMWADYRLFGLEGGRASATRVPHASHWAIPNRVSYFFDFQGPSVAIDTACSSSLTAIHMAIDNLRSGACQVAVAGGINLSIHPIKYRVLSQEKFASDDGKCRSFGEGGTGYVPGEGVGVVVLKPLHAARRDGDHLYGVIKASVLNHGGKTNGFTVPNPNAQANLVRRALDQCGIDPRRIGYVEAHGTGTSLGDPIEIVGLTHAFTGASDEPKQYCPIGSVKSNIGHLEGAAGIAGLTKVLLQMQHGQLVPSLHSEPVNPKINFQDSPFYVQTRLESWARQTEVVRGISVEVPRVAAVSAFGAGGANAHLIVEEPPLGATSGLLDLETPRLFLLSARGRSQLAQAAGNFCAHLRAHADLDLDDVAYTLQVGREAFEYRLAMIANNRDQLLEILDEFVVMGADVVALRHDGTRIETIAPSAENEADDERRLIASSFASGDLDLVAASWAAGTPIDWSGLHAGSGALRRRVSLPTYPFVRDRYWVSEVLSRPPNLVPSMPVAD